VFDCIYNPTQHNGDLSPGKLYMSLMEEREWKEPLRRCRETIILKHVLKKWDGRAWSGFIWLRVGTNQGLF